jgi:type I restriction enzyme, S subunit
MATERGRAARLLPKLEQAILAKAFSGNLVPQDPNDEPASGLLAHIRAARAQAPIRKSGRSTTSNLVPRAPREKAIMTKNRYDDDVKDKPYLASRLRQMGKSASVEELFKRSQLPVTDFYKQLAWEVDAGHILDDNKRLEAR